MQTTPLNVRFDELTQAQQAAFSLLINSVASHSLSFDDDMKELRKRDIKERLQNLEEALIEAPTKTIY